MLAAVCLLAQFGLSDSVESVRFAGNRAFSSKVFQRIVAVQQGDLVDEGHLDEDAGLIEKFYYENGFLDAGVEKGLKRGKKQWVATFYISEGTRARVSVVALTGNYVFDAHRLLNLVPVKPGQPFTSDLLSESGQVLKRFYLNRGYPFVQVIGSWRFEDTLVSLTFVIQEGPRCHISKLLVRGNRTVSSAVILQTAEIKLGELFRYQRFYEAQQRLYATKLFRRASFYVFRPDILVDSIAVRFDVVEQPYRIFSVGGGFETPWRLLFSLGWEHSNLFDCGHSLGTDVEYSPNFSGDYRVSLGATYRVPYFVLNRVDLSTRPLFYWEQVDTVLRREYGVETGLSRSLLPRLSIGLFNRFRFVADTSRGITNALALNMQYDSRDDIFNPTLGLYLRPVAEIAGGILLGDNDFYRLAGEARLFQSLGFGFVLAARGMAGRDFPYGRTQKIPCYEGFMLGGRNSLRGYDEHSLGPDSSGTERFGPMVLNTNLELRTPYVFGRLGAVIFLDGGEVVGTETGFTLEDYAYSAGGGIRVMTPVGPVRLDWGKRLRNPSQGDKGRFYLGLLHAF